MIPLCTSQNVTEKKHVYLGIYIGLSHCTSLLFQTTWNYRSLVYADVVSVGSLFKRPGIHLFPLIAVILFQSSCLGGSIKSPSLNRLISKSDIHILERAHFNIIIIIIITLLFKDHFSQQRVMVKGGGTSSVEFQVTPARDTIQQCINNLEPCSGAQPDTKSGILYIYILI
jgi:hypothetical protein